MPGIMGLRFHLIPTEKQRTRAMSLKETLSGLPPERGNDKSSTQGNRVKKSSTNH
jgi:hypothetical protein